MLLDELGGAAAAKASTICAVESEMAETMLDDAAVFDEPRALPTLVCPVLSASSFCFALASVELAESTSACNAVVSSVARVSPLLTVSPVFTFTDFTVPDDENAGVNFSDEVIVPDDSTVWVTEPSETVATRRVVPLPLVAAIPTALPPPITTTPTATATARRRRARRRRERRAGDCSATVGPSAETDGALPVGRIGDPDGGRGDRARRVGLALGGHALSDLDRGRRRGRLGGDLRARADRHGLVRGGRAARTVRAEVPGGDHQRRTRHGGDLAAGDRAEVRPPRGAARREPGRSLPGREARGPLPAPATPATEGAGTARAVDGGTDRHRGGRERRRRGVRAGRCDGGHAITGLDRGERRGDLVAELRRRAPRHRHLAGLLVLHLHRRAGDSGYRAGSGRPTLTGRAGAARATRPARGTGRRRGRGRVGGGATSAGRAAARAERDRGGEGRDRNAQRSGRDRRTVRGHA